MDDYHMFYTEGGPSLEQEWGDGYGHGYSFGIGFTRHARGDGTGNQAGLYYYGGDGKGRFSDAGHTDGNGACFWLPEWLRYK